MTSAVVDTDVLIDVLRNSPGAKEYFLSQIATGLRHSSAITVAEIRAGMRPDEQQATMTLLDALEILPVNKEIALLGGALKDAAKQRIKLDDCLIAATAIRHGLSLVTRNVRHYQHSGLTVMPAAY